MSMKRLGRWGAIGSGLVLCLAFLAACGGDDDDSGSGEGGQGAQTESGDASLGDRENIMHHLQAVDQTYASGESEEAQTHLDEATSAWGSLSATFSEQEAGEIQGQLDSLAQQLSSSAPATDITEAVETISTELAAGPDAPAG
jgi:hypothetical protein